MELLTDEEKIVIEKRAQKCPFLASMTINIDKYHDIY
jgi:hypothetical protein